MGTSGHTPTSLTADQALVRLDQYREHTSTWSTATYDDGTERALAQIAGALATEVERLRTERGPLDDMTPQTCPTGEHPDWAVDSADSHTCPWCEIERLRGELAKYVGHEPTIAEEMAYQERFLDAVLTLCEHKDSSTSEWVAEVRAVAMGAQGGRTVDELRQQVMDLKQRKDPAVLRDAAHEIVSDCPDHGDNERDTGYMSCHCAASDYLRRLADEADTGGGS